MRIVPIVLAVAVMTLAGGATAQSPGVIRVCVKNDDGNMRFVAAGPCKANETPLTWNQAGPAGPAGVPGSAGPAGATGAPGPGWALVAANGAVLYGMQDPTGELRFTTYALVPLPDGGLAGVPLRFYNLNSRPYYTIDLDNAFLRFESSDCSGSPFLKADELSLYFGSTRFSAAYRGSAGSSVMLGVATAGQIVGRFDGGYLSNGTQCMPGTQQWTMGHDVELHIDLTQQFPDPITPRAF